MESNPREAISAGLRTIAVAYKEEAEEFFTRVGLICFDDPIRKGVPEAIASCKQAGVRVIMIMGDHAATAKRVAENARIEITDVLAGDELGKIPTEKLAAAVKSWNLFARISPEQRLIIVTALRESGKVISVWI